ncbi:IS21 family transposase [Bacillus daqingensis]|uniref:IS21 family transposase n=1 Tax=Bacillus daqingensis TaxID=872396 RepID=A0ABV9NWG1_9BACI
MKYAEVRKLQDLGFSINAIAKKLKMSRNTVKEYIGMEPEEFEDFLVSLRTRSKKLDPFRDEILKWLQEHPDLTGAQVYDWLEERMQFNETAENTVRNYVKELREIYHIPKTVRQREYASIPESFPGQQAQVDFGQTVVETKADGRKHLYFIAFILSHSRYKYVEWLDRPFRTSDVVRCHENAFVYYEGMPVEMVYDQDALLAVSENAGDLILTAAFTKYQAARGFQIYLCRKNDPESKGKVEQVVKFVKHNFSKHRLFETLDNWNDACLAWLDRTGNHKVHHNIKKRPSEVHALEKQHLRNVSTSYLFEEALPITITRNIQKDNVVRYLQNRYSVPSGTYQETSANKAYLQVTDDQTLVIRLKPTGPILAQHALSLEKGLVISDPLHREKKESTRSLLVHQLTEAFSDKTGIQWFIEALSEKYPRHLVDQLKVIQKAIRHHPTSADGALKEVQKLQLISGNDFRDIVYSLELQSQKPLASDMPLNQKYIDLAAPERSSATYLSVLSGGRKS